MKMSLTSLMVTAIAVCTVNAEAKPDGHGINTFGLELHQRLAKDGGNIVASPWSIQSALAMTYAGAAGKTRDEMAATLHFGEDEKALHANFAAIAGDLSNLVKTSKKNVAQAGRHGGPSTLLEITTANRLFGEKNFSFEKPFLALLKKSYDAPLEALDFGSAPEFSRKHINDWIAGQTKDRIKDLIPQGAIDPDTRLVLANAIYMKAAWQSEFSKEADAPFFVNGTQAVKVAGLVKRREYGYLKIPGGVIVTVPYADDGLQFLIMVPDEKEGLVAMEKNLTADLLQQAASAPRQEIELHYPKFKLEPPSIALADHLAAMGMPTAFIQGTADFSGMASEKLSISQVVHKGFVAVDEYGTEAAAATAVIVAIRSALIGPEQPLEIRVDRPFAFAIQHTKSGACLFLGRVTDPR